MKHRWTKYAIWDLNNQKWRKWCKIVVPFLFNNNYGLPGLTKDTKCPNQVFYVWLVDLQTICAKKGMETCLPPNNNIRIFLLDMRPSWTKNAFLYVNNKKRRKWCEFASSFLSNNTYGLPGLTKYTKCRSQVFYVWLDDRQTICAKFVLETWLSPNDGIRKCLFYMTHGLTKYASGDVNNKKCRKWCKFVSSFLFNNYYGLPVLTMDTKRPNQICLVWFVL
jgi:Holliday junction resolvase-like predicted endonuclease